jgi:hypothetical protein
MTVLTELRSAIVAAVGFDRVWELRLPQLQHLPAITYHSFGSDHDYLIDGPLGRATLNLQVDIWSRSLSEAKSVSESVRVALSGYSGGSIDVCILDSAFETFELEESSDQPLYHLAHQYRVIYSESA